jgi:hypothetical protein
MTKFFRILTSMILCISIVGCTTAQLQTTGAAIVTNAPTIIAALGQTGILGPKGTADANAAGWALQVLTTKQIGSTITPSDLTTGIAQVDKVLAANVSTGVLTKSGASKLLTVASTLINGQTSP